MSGTGTPRLRLTRDLVARLPSRVDAEGPILVDVTSETYHAEMTERVLAETEGALWVFAAGSLIWNPRFDVQERRHARVEGWQRSFSLGPIRRGRGNPEAPGRMMTLDAGGECHGFVFRMQDENRAEVLENLLRQEPPHPPSWVVAQTPQGDVRAIAFTIDDRFGLYSPEPGIEELADMLASAVGTRGTMAEYLLNTVEHLAEAGILDPHLWRLQEMVAERLERLDPRPG